MSSTIMLLGILAAFVLLGYMCMKGWSVYISAPLCAIIIALTSGMGPLSAITESFLPGTGNYLAQWFGLFMLGALFGKIMETSGAAASIAHSVTKLIGAGNACIAVILATSLMTYGGISLFVVVFVMYPFAVSLFQDADLPKRLLPGCIATGAFSYTAMALPGSPQNQNVLPTTYFGTTPTAAPVLGLIVSAYILIVSILYMNWRAKQAKANLEHFVPNEKDLAIMEANKNRELPHIAVSLLPLLVVVCSIIFLKWNHDGLPPARHCRVDRALLRQPERRVYGDGQPGCAELNSGNYEHVSDGRPRRGREGLSRVQHHHRRGR